MIRVAALIVLAFAGVARADTVDVTASLDDLAAATTKLEVRLDEPIGLEVVVPIAKLGLQTGDVIRAVNGVTASDRAPLGAGNLTPALIYLDVARGAKSLTVRIAVQRDTAELHLDVDTFKQQMNDLYLIPSIDLEPVQRSGRPTGLVLHTGIPSLGLVAGDVIRTVDGVDTTSDSALRTALDQAGAKTRFTIISDRGSQHVTATVLLADWVKLAGIDKIKQVDATTFEVPRSVYAVLSQHPEAVAHHARIVPALKDGKPDGGKLYAVRPDSMYAKLGLANGDTLHSIAGVPVSTAEQAFAAWKALGANKVIQVELTRKGSPLTLTYRLVP